jgi:hypothetical protein
MARYFVRCWSRFRTQSVLFLHVRRLAGSGGNHRTMLRVLPITDGERSYVEWFSSFDIAPEHEAQLVDLMNRNFLAGLRSLAEKVTRD